MATFNLSSLLLDVLHKSVLPRSAAEMRITNAEQNVSIVVFQLTIAHLYFRLHINTNLDIRRLRISMAACD